MSQYNKLSKSFGLIEVVVAIGILLLIIGAVTTLGVLSVRGTVIARNRTEAYQIAQEAMEVIKARRDWVWDNWNEIAGVTWANFWDSTSNISGAFNEINEIKNNLESNCLYIDHSTAALSETSCSTSSPPSGTRFTRSINFDDVTSSVSSALSGLIYRVTVTVSWNDYYPQSISLTSYLSDWQPRF